MHNSKYFIKTITNNKEKEEVYRKNIQLFNKAKSYEFYFQCLWILYAMLEDRTLSLIYYLGFTSENKRTSVTGTKKIKKDIRSIFNMNSSKDKYKFNNLSGKLSRIYNLISWGQSENELESNYLTFIRKSIIKISNNKDFINALNYLTNEWREKRNQLTHALFNKNQNAVFIELPSLLNKGFIAMRAVDKVVSQVKRLKIRKLFNIK